MICKFCVSTESFKANKTAVFCSESGEEYIVKYAYEFRDIFVTVQWTLPKNVLVTVDLNTADMKNIASKSKIGKGKLSCINFPDVLKSSDDPVECKFIFVISVIPFAELKDWPINANGNTCESNKVEEMSDPLENTLIGLAVDMRNLLISENNSDVVLTNGTKDCRVHSAIVSARSPIFKELLTHSLEEKKIIIAGASNDALDDMVMFIYCGFIKITDIKRAEELYELAHKFQIEDLREVCSMHLSNLTVDRALNALIFADKYNDDFLKSVSVNFIAKNLHKLKADEKWKVFAKENFNLVTETLSLISDVFEKDTLYEFLLRLSDKSKKAVVSGHEKL